MRLGLSVYALAAMAAGIVDLVWGRLDPAHQPLQAWGDDVPGQQFISYALAILLVVGGGTLLWRRSERFGAGVLAFVYLVFAFFWLPRFYTAPLVLGASAPVYIGVLGGVCENLAVVAAAVSLFSPRSSAAEVALRIFGVCAICFGLVHLTAIHDNIVYVPKWMPFGRPFWVGFTGVAFVLAGISILIGILNVLAARLLAIMWLVFSAFTLLPGLAAAPHYLASWGGNAYNILVAASAWIVADWLRRRKEIPEPRLSAAT